jgi:transposase
MTFGMGRRNIKHKDAKKRDVMASFEKYPDLTNPVLAARHHVSISTIVKWKAEYKKRLERLAKNEHKDI